MLINSTDRVVSFSGVLEAVHSIPGRMRLRIPSLRHRPKAMEEFAVRLKRLDGIIDVTVNPFFYDMPETKK